MRLSKEVGRSLSAHGWTVGIAESITGGLVANTLTDEPGSSAYFLGGVVAYSNRSKVELLGVRGSTLRSHGAVSQECAVEMAKGARKVFGSELGAACTGIAGPTGGTKTKPIGLVFIAVDDGKRTVVEEEHFQGDRRAIKEQTAERMLELILLSLEPLE